MGGFFGCGGGAFAGGAVFEAVAPTGDLEDFGVVQKAVEDGGGGGNVTEEFAPFFEGAVGGHEGGAQFVAAHDDFEEVFAAFGRELFDAHVVDDEEIAAEVVVEDFLMPLGVVGVVTEVGEDVEDGTVEDGFAEFDQGVADGLGEVALAHSGRAEQEKVAGLVDKSSGGEVVDLGAADGGVEGEVEVFEGALFAEGGRFGAPGDGALLTDVEFVGEDGAEEFCMAEVVAAGFLEAKFKGGEQAGKAELTGLVLDGGGGHGFVFWFCCFWFC